MAITQLNELFLEHLSDAYSAENQILKALPTLISAAKDEDLADSLRNHLEETEGHVRRLDEVFALVDETPAEITCLAIQGILKEADKEVGEVGPDLTDIVIAGGAAKVEHYEISSYTSLVEMADALGHDEAVSLLKDTLGEEEAAAKKVEGAFKEGVGELAS